MRRGRRNYRGSRRGGTLIPVLVVLCIIAGGVLFFVSDSETYTKSGEKVIVAPKDNAEKEKNSGVVIEQTAGEKTEEKESDVLPDKKSRVMRGYFADINTVKNAELFDSAVETAKKAGNVNTLILEVKAQDGTLAFASDHEFIKDKQLSGDDDMLKAVMAKAKEQGFSVALYVSCFKDNGAAHSNFENAVKQKDNGWIWRDGSNMRWLSAYSEDSRDYIVGVVEQIAKFEPDEIILSNISFPVEGNLASIDYGDEAGDKGEAVSAFLEDVAKAADGIPLSAVYENYSAKLLPLSGQDISVFKETFTALYVKRKADENTLSFDTAKTAVADEGYRLIPIVSSIEGEDSEYMLKK